MSLVLQNIALDKTETVPNNVGRNRKYKGVGAHLFEDDYKISWNVGNEEYMQHTAKTDLVSHYLKELNAKR